MSITKIIAAQPDLPGGGYVWDTTTYSMFDKTRVSGAFRIYATTITLPIPAATTETTWYHMRIGSTGSFQLNRSDTIRLYDSQGATLCVIYNNEGQESLRVYGDTEDIGPNRSLGMGVIYTYDLKVTVREGVDLTVALYVNGALIRTVTLANVTAGKLKPASATFGQGRQSIYDQYNYLSEMIVATEDTRGMRLREMRPTSFGAYQEWSGPISALRDSDLATGITTDVADRRASFGVSNLKYLNNNDVINRVVTQTYAQKGETGMSAYNHFFRFGDGTIHDYPNIPLDIYGDWHIEEYPVDPRTGVGWIAENLQGIQPGIRSRL